MRERLATTIVALAAMREASRGKQDNATGERRGATKPFIDLVQFELRHAELVSLLAGHIQ